MSESTKTKAAYNIGYGMSYPNRISSLYSTFHGRDVHPEFEFKGPYGTKRTVIAS